MLPNFPYILGRLWMKLQVGYSFSYLIYKLMVKIGFQKRINGDNFAKSFKKKWLRKENDKSFFNFNGAILPDITEDVEKTNLLMVIFEDIFFISCFLNDNYEKSIVRRLDKYMPEGPYCYYDGDFNVTVKSKDIVIDAGAWVGDFSAYAASKGASVYAFEPEQEIFNLLNKTAELNNGRIHPIQKGLGSKECMVPFSINKNNSGASTLILNKNNVEKNMIPIITLDKFVKENNINHIDFIKADIEGAEREMIKGAVNTLKNFSPKLSICTYHLPDDPNVLENLILEINPQYTIVHIRHKLFAAVIN
ncbi:hypothetical protein FACS1894137_11600 [Spirochaetia bacterium]|nr:hypothetical protein FACS1894137_11600 [Spirochaetia bacterium]